MKKRRFGGYPWPCLCLIFPVLMAACKSAQQLIVAQKNYELTVAINPGMSDSDVYRQLEGIAFAGAERKEAVFLNTANQSEVLVFKLRAHDEQLISKAVSRLESEGVRILSLKTENR